MFCLFPLLRADGDVIYLHKISPRSLDVKIMIFLLYIMIYIYFICQYNNTCNREKAGGI